MTKQHSKQFKEDAVHYYESHKELGQKGCAKNLGIGESTLTNGLNNFVKMEKSLCEVLEIILAMNKRKLHV